jgi:hypothetical protein
MSLPRRLLLTIILPAVLAVATTAAEPDGEIDMFAPLGEGGCRGAVAWETFHEDDAEGAEIWDFEDGVLVCRGTPLGYLHTKGEYADFVLKLEWRWPPDGEPGRGGVLIRTTGPDKIWPKSLEAQINAGDAGDFWGLDGYQLDGPAERKKTIEHDQFGTLTNLQKTEAAEKPAGEWNQYEIRAEGDTVTLTINGKEVNRATGCETAPGVICLTAEGNEIHFRNVRIRPLGKREE